jgi:hypothetical protein
LRGLLYCGICGRRSRRLCENSRTPRTLTATHAASEQARREIADCDAKLRAHPTALEAQRIVAQARLRHGPGRQRMTNEEITGEFALHDQR